MNVAETYYQTGEIQYRFARYLADDGITWVYHGRFVAFHRNGQLASEGNYIDGLEEGVWRSYHDDGQLAAEGCYRQGEQTGTWRYWENK